MKSNSATTFEGCRVSIYDIDIDETVQAILISHIGNNNYTYKINHTKKPLSKMKSDEVGIGYSSSLSVLNLISDDFEFETVLEDNHYDKREYSKNPRFWLGSPTGKKREEALKIGWGSVETPEMFRNVHTMPFIMDNGVFAYWNKGEAFNEKLFLKRLDYLKINKITPEFVVIPDIVGNWKETKESYYRWIDILTQRYGNRFNYALVLQEGVEVRELDELLFSSPEVSWIFIGGASNFNGFGKAKSKKKEWKFEFAEKAIPIAKKYGVKVHIGRVSSMVKIKMANALRADSMDSSMPNFSPQQFDRYKRGMKSIHKQASLDLFAI